MFEIRHYTTEDGRDPVQSWLDDLRDQEAKARILARLDRVQQGGFGDCMTVGSGIRELRIHYGRGGGDKKTQRTDIAVAQKRLKDWKSKHREANP